MASFPTGAAYTITTLGGSSPNSETLTGPGGSLATNLPAVPLFTISGVTGSWLGNTFKFDPTGVTSFTVTINSYSVTNPGGNFGWGYSVESAGTIQGEDGAGPLVDATPYTAPVLTFTNGLGANAGDGDPTTFGFVNGATFNLEANFTNIIGLAAASNLGGQMAFLYGTNTSFIIEVGAVPEPSTHAAIMGALALGGVVWARRRRA